MNKVNVIAHTHWDREWYFTSQRSEIYSTFVFDEILDFLDENQEFHSFLLDGQTSIIDDYLKFRPEKEELVKKLVRERRLITGPWYTQTDTLVISGESILRNLLYGIKDSNKYGGYQKIGYLPDSFGMSSQLPMLFNQFNLKYAVFRRGIADHLLKDREFIWKSNSGDKIKSFNIYHYGVMAYPPNDANEEYFEELISKLEKFGNREPYILFNGEDQKPVRKNLQKLNEASGMDIKIASLEDSLDELFEANKDNLKEYSGEFTFGQFSRTHKSIFSTRADLKNKNNFLERLISHKLEPLMSLAYNLGLRYESEIIEKIWRLMLDNSAHDSIGMCNSDLTNKFIENRYDIAYDYASNLIDLICRRIGDRIQPKDFSFQAYNLSPNKRDDFIKFEILVPFENFEIKRDGKNIDYLILSREDFTDDLKKSQKEIGVNNEESSNLNNYDRLNKFEVLIFDSFLPMGYQTYDIIESKELKECEIKKTSCDYIENEFYKIVLEDNGHIKVVGDSNISEIYLENNGDEGDSYDYSSPSKDLYINEGTVDNVRVEKNIFFEKLSFNLKRILPSNLKDREKGILNAYLVSKIDITLYKGKKFIEVSQETTNQIHEHRDRLVVASKISSDYSLSDNQFSTIIREVDYNKYSNWKDEKWDEKPRGIEPMISFAGLDSDKTVQVVSDGVREYEILDHSKIALTTFRSIPYLGKENLNDRPGRASGVYKKELGHEMMGKTIKTNFYIRDCDKNYYDMHKFAHDALNKPFAYQAGEILDNTNNFVIPKDHKALDKDYSLLEVEGNVIFSTLKKEEYGDKLLLRLYNPNIDKEEEYKIKDKTYNTFLADELTELERTNVIKASDLANLKLN
ncbi:glycoside hydrolase family 38 C-terminal domain-containing protein [uncultured Anaerococcus sp.]|uniref:glycoside hydrolase family 38 N-terminal domain-containing protein n=1 Tax=uncultured Anaerococcus sp. TaxID=293428 RepID=UPI00280B1C46|nr:glycoside hydrolase family 38 C-terminal domain-containing protein [uncultured Anaerococcus sp.]